MSIEVKDIGAEFQPLDPEVVKAYNKTRGWFDRKYVCNAPFNNMYFNVMGQVGPCWLTYLGGERWPNRSIHEIWFGGYFEKLRTYIKEKDLSKKCQMCKYNLEHGNHVSVLANAYDLYKPAHYPAMMEFELDNICNLECVMCKGELSSSIRRNREKLPPIETPYNSDFVDQLEEFIPHLKEARFNGGEPFLIPIYFDIWEKMLAINPKIKIVIATNASVLNNRVKDILERGNFHLNISIDGMSAESYETIRVRGKLDRVLENFEWFLQYAKSRKTTICLMANPMRQNWRELPDFVRYCNERDIPLWFNTIDYPLDQALVTLPSADLQELYDTLSPVTFERPNSCSKAMHDRNTQIYKNVAQVQIKNWLEEAKVREQTEEERKIAAEAKANEVEEVKEDVVVETPNPVQEIPLSQLNLRQLVFKKLRDQVSQDPSIPADEKDTYFEKITGKIDAIYERVRGDFREDDFFNMMNMAPMEAVVMYLEVESVDALVEKVYSSRTA